LITALRYTVNEKYTYFGLTSDAERMRTAVPVGTKWVSVSFV